MSTVDSVETLEEALDTLEEIANAPASKKLYLGMALVWIGGAAFGSVVTHYVTKKKSIKDMDERVEAEVAASVALVVKKMGLGNIVVTDDDPDELYPNEVDVTPDVWERNTIDAIEAEPEPLEEVEGTRVVASEDEKPPLENLRDNHRNQKIPYNQIASPSFDDGPEEEIVPEEPAYQDPDITTISRDLFEDQTSGYEQEIITWFADGGVLDVSLEWVIDPVDKIGANKPAFGDMSDDPNVVYLRNKRLQKEFQVIQDPGNASDFAEKMEGEDPEVSDELMHSLVEHYNGRRTT